MTNIASPLYPFPDVGGPRQSGESHAPIGLGALQPALSETDVSVQTPYGPVSVVRHYAKGSMGAMPNPIGDIDWTHSLHSMVRVLREKPPRAGTEGCRGASCTSWTVLEPSGEVHTFTPCTPQGNQPCYAGGAHEDGPHEWAPEVERRGGLSERNLQLRWDGRKFELLRPGRERLVYRLVIQRPEPIPRVEWYGSAVYALTEIHGAPNAAGDTNRLALLSYEQEGVSPCPNGEMAIDTPALRTVSLASGARLAFDWADAKKPTCPRPTWDENASPACKSQPLQCVLSGVGLSGMGQSTTRVEYEHDRDPQGYRLPGKLVLAKYPSLQSTQYLRTETIKASPNAWEEQWRVFDDGRERFTQTVTNVLSSWQPANTYEFITQSKSETGSLEVRALHGSEHLTCVARPSDGGSDSANGWLDVSADDVVRFVGSTGLAVYEYLLHETGAVPTWTTLRFPGQYHDAETDLFENWNRYYSPSTGRYLASDPMLRDSAWILDSAFALSLSSPYVYALNDPAGVIDPPGLEGAQVRQDAWRAFVDPQNSKCLEKNPGSINCQTAAQELRLSGYQAQAAGAALGLAILGAAEAGPAAVSAVIGTARKAGPAVYAAMLAFIRKIKFDGPSSGLRYANGRIFQVRYGSLPLVRLDLHPLKGSGGKPVLHLNVGTGEANHIWLWPSPGRRN